MPGPIEEIAIIAEVFQLHVMEHHTSTEIATMLNKRGIPWERGRPWTRYVIRRMVTNPKYIGANVTNRLLAKLRGRRVTNPPQMWIRKDDAFESIVDSELFGKAVERRMRAHDF